MHFGRLKRQLDAAYVPSNGVEEADVLAATYISFYDPHGIDRELYAMPRKQSSDYVSRRTTRTRTAGSLPEPPRH